MKSKPVIFLLLVAILISTSAFAQESKPAKTSDSAKSGEYDYIDNYLGTAKLSNLYNNSVGVRYSNISGYGLCMSTKFLDFYTVNISGMIQYTEYIKWNDLNKTKEIENQKDILYDFGVELRRDLITTKGTNIYALIGAYTSDFKNKDINNEKYESKYVVGIGFGLQWFFHKQFAGDLSLGYKFDNTNTQEGGQPSVERKTGIGVGIGAIFFF